MIRCWQHFKCKKSECPAYGTEDGRCWLKNSTFCHDKIQGNLLGKMETCAKCDVFLANFKSEDCVQTMSLISEQFKEYDLKVAEKTSQLEEAKRKLTEFKLTSIYTLKKLDSKSIELSKAKSSILNIVDSIHDSLIVFDPEGIIELVNQTTLELLEFSENELLGKRADIIFDERKNPAFFKDSIVDELVKHGVVKNRNVTFLTKRNEEIPMNLSGQSVKDENGKIAGFVCTGRDMREMSRLVNALQDARSNLEKKVDERTKELREMQVQLIQSAKMATMGQFAAGIAHEINNPLGAIINYIRVVLSNHQLQGQDKGYLELSLKGLFKIENIVRQILVYSARKSSDPKPTNINQVVQDSIAFMHHKLSKKEILLETGLDKSLLEIIVDPSQMQQIFINIISNAIDAMNSGGKLTIETFFRDSEQCIRFIDTGKGIKEEDLGRIFDPFYTTKEVGEGTGLGLFVSYNIIQIYRGGINITSDVGKGTTVLITLPQNTETVK